jgi:hypothetical protein
MSKVISVALKQWAIVVDVILEGRQCLLLQKGDFGEVHREFKIDHPEFLLFPTYEEQRAEHLLPPWRDKLQRIQNLRPDGSHIILKGYCEVEAVWEVRSLVAVQESSGMIWSPEHLRAEYPEGTTLCALMVRAHRLSQSREIANLRGYASSRGWVSLLDEISIEGARPAMTDEAFRRQASELQRILG